MCKNCMFNIHSLYWAPDLLNRAHALDHALLNRDHALLNPRFSKLGSGFTKSRSDFTKSGFHLISKLSIALAHVHVFKTHPQCYSLILGTKIYNYAS